MTSTPARSSRLEGLVESEWRYLYIWTTCEGIGMHMDGVMAGSGNMRGSTMITRVDENNGMEEGAVEAEHQNVNVS